MPTMTDILLRADRRRALMDPKTERTTPNMSQSLSTTPSAAPCASTLPTTQGPMLGCPAPRDPSERRTLIVGRSISVQGTITDAERLVVEGTIEATMIHAAELAIPLGGVFRGQGEVEDADIAGTIDGALTVRGSLVVRGTGKVIGTARYGRLRVEDGGEITGQIEMIRNPSGTKLPPAIPPR